MPCMVALLCCSCPVLFNLWTSFGFRCCRKPPTKRPCTFKFAIRKDDLGCVAILSEDEEDFCCRANSCSFNVRWKLRFYTKRTKGIQVFFSSITRYETRIQLNIQGPDTAGNQESSRRRKLGPSLQEGRLMAANAERKLGLSMLFSWQDFKSARMRKSACCVAQSAAFFRIYCVVSDQAS